MQRNLFNKIKNVNIISNHQTTITTSYNRATKLFRKYQSSSSSTLTTCVNNNESTDGNGSFLVDRYRAMINESNNNAVLLDQHQLRALKELDRLRNDILSSPLYTTDEAKSSSPTTFIGDGEDSDSFFSYPFMDKLQNVATLFGASGSSSSRIEERRTAGSSSTFKGVYLHGGVGCGKTFCMNLFYDHLPISSKQQVHFHKFMLGVHKQMHEAKMIDGIKGDVLPTVINRTVKRGRVICFDEFQVTDVADALISRRFFTGLLDEGAVLVMTSNRPPSDLYLNGLQRDLFLPFIDLLYEKCEVVSMWESETDYRLVQGANKARGVYFVGKKSKMDFEDAFTSLTKGSNTSSTFLTVQGRNVPIPQASMEYQVARFSFNDLCRKARGAADYLAIGENFHTVFIDQVPVLTMNDVNLVRRFIVFVDAMYECHVKLIVHAETAPDGIFQVDLKNRHCDEAFAFDRTRSRLEEMGSDAYLKRRWIGHVEHGDNDDTYNKVREVVLDDRDIQR